MSSKQTPLTISQWDSGIAKSPHKGFGLMSRVEIESFPGAVKVQKALSALFPTAISDTFTADAGTDLCTAASGSFPTSYSGRAVTLTTTGTLPAGLATNTIYFMIPVSPTTFKLATTYTNAVAATPIDITDAGTGVHTFTSVNHGQINFIIKYSTSVYIMQDGNGRIWISEAFAVPYLMPGNTLTGATGNGIVIFKNSDASATYLFAFRSASIDVINITNSANRGTPVWSNAWQALNSGAGTGNRHHAIVGQDSAIYFTDSRYVGSIIENAGSVFDPATGGTYTYNNQALDTPQDEILVHLEELGTNLLAAGSTYNKIYPWDRISDSFDLPIIVPEVNVQRLKNIGGTVYILAGSWGNIYTTQGIYAKFFTKIPDQISNNSGTLSSSPITWGGIDAVNGALLVGVGYSGGGGAFLIYPDDRMVIDQIPTAGARNVLSFHVENNFYTIGYASGADYSTTSRYSSYEGVVQSAFYRVATKTEKGAFSKLEIRIAKILNGGHIRVKYRFDTLASFSDFSTAVAWAPDGTANSQMFDIGLTDIEDIQIQAELDGNVELLEIKLIP